MQNHNQPQGTPRIGSSALLGVRYFMSQCFEAIHHRLIFLVKNLSLWRAFFGPLKISNVKLLIFIQCFLYSHSVCFGELAGKLNRDLPQLNLRFGLLTPHTSIIPYLGQNSVNDGDGFISGLQFGGVILGTQAPPVGEIRTNRPSEYGNQQSDGLVIGHWSIFILCALNGWGIAWLIGRSLTPNVQSSGTREEKP